MAAPAQPPCTCCTCPQHGKILDPASYALLLAEYAVHSQPNNLSLLEKHAYEAKSFQAVLRLKSLREMKSLLEGNGVGKDNLGEIVGYYVQDLALFLAKLGYPLMNGKIDAATLTSDASNRREQSFIKGVMEAKNKAEQKKHAMARATEKAKVQAYITNKSNEHPYPPKPTISHPHPLREIHIPNEIQIFTSAGHNPFVQATQHTLPNPNQVGASFGTGVEAARGKEKENVKTGVKAIEGTGEDGGIMSKDVQGMRSARFADAAEDRETSRMSFGTDSGIKNGNKMDVDGSAGESYGYNGERSDFADSAYQILYDSDTGEFYTNDPKYAGGAFDLDDFENDYGYQGFDHADVEKDIAEPAISSNATPSATKAANESMTVNGLLADLKVQSHTQTAVKRKPSKEAVEESEVEETAKAKKGKKVKKGKKEKGGKKAAKRARM